MRTNRFLSFFLVVLGITTSSSSLNPGVGDPFTRDLFEMEGMLIEHPINDTVNHLSDRQILELQDENGLTIWFARFFFKDICITGLCNMARFWIFWDGTGNYLGLRLNENQPLTKADHIDFLQHDYIRLNEILEDTSSILLDLEYEDLAFEEQGDSNDPESLYSVDSFSGATPTDLARYVVQDAVFTCYTLWHTTYGNTRDEILAILETRIDPGYIGKLLEGNSRQQNFGVELIRQRDHLFPDFKPRLFEIISSRDYVLSKKTISFIPDTYFQDPGHQLEFIDLLDTSLPEIKFEILYRLQLVEGLSEEAILLLLDKHSSGVINAGGLNQVFRIIARQVDGRVAGSKQVNAKLDELSKSSNPEIANLIKNFLKSFR